MSLPDPIGGVVVYVDDRISFRKPAEDKATAVLTGDDASRALEARAALHGGKVLQEVRIAVKRDDREYRATLRAPALDVSGLKLPSVTREGEESAVIERMFLVEEFTAVLQALFQAFGEVRASAAWETTVRPAMSAWVVGEPSAA